MVQDTTGQLHVAGARQEQTLYTLDGFQINNPATGAFDARVTVDSVREADMSTGRYGTQFANAGTSVMAIQTDTGDDRRKFGITNFLPSLSTQRGVHLGNFFPRVTYSGPIKPGRAWFAQAAILRHDFTLVRELPPGGDISQQWSVDNLMRVQYNVTPSHSLQGNFLYNYSTATRVGLNAFAPAETTFDTHSHLYFFSARDQITIKNGLIDIGIASDTNHGGIVPQGTQPYVITPTGPLGNYLLNQVQNSHRWHGLADAILSGRKWHGSHDLHFGWNIERTHMDQISTRRPVLVQQENTAVVREASFSGNANIAASLTQGGAYAQDAWQLTRDVIFQSTLRVDWNDFIHRLLPQPRFVLSWTPGHSLSKISMGWGLYYQPIYPVLPGQASDQSRQDLLVGPQQDVTSSLLTSFQLASGLRQPFFNMTSVEWERQWNERTSSSVNFLQRQEHHGLSYGGTNATLGTSLQLSDQRADRYDSAEFTLRRTLRPGSEVMVDYMYSRARSNQIFTYSAENLVLANQAGGRLPWDTPNRVISRAAFPTKRGGLLLTYFAEYHTGFPFCGLSGNRNHIARLTFIHIFTDRVCSASS